MYDVEEVSKELDSFEFLQYRITKNFRDKKLSRISRILEFRESFFREI